LSKSSLPYCVPEKLIKGIRKAIVEFELIEPKDRILVGLSGGKDSSLLLLSLAQIARHLPFPVEIQAMHIDLGFIEQDKADYSGLKKISDLAGVPFATMREELADDILHNPQQSPCSRCSYWRRALIHNYAKDHNFNKVAFAHHLDDAVETFLMGLLYSGQIGTFLPKTYLDRTGVTVIRPLVYLREKDIRGAVKSMGIEVVPSPCPMDGYTKRSEVKELIKELCRDNPLVFDHLVSAMREGKKQQLWPAPVSRRETREKNLNFWARKE